MAKFQNVFISGILDKDNNNRIVTSDSLVDAENFIVITTENSNRGVGRNVPGNVKLTTNNLVNAEELGSTSNATNDKIYYFLKTTTFDYLFEFNLKTKVNTPVLQTSPNGALNLKSGERIINIDLIYSGEEYDATTQQGGTLITWSGDSNPPRIGNIERMKLWGVDGFQPEEIMLIKAPPLFPPQIELLNTISEAENFIKDKFISFATRFKYKDGYYSAISGYEEYAFSPKTFELDFNSKQNKGMINSVNAVNIKFETGPREVIAIDLLFKYSNSHTVYKVDQFNKTDKSWANNVIIPNPILFDNSKIYQILAENQFTRSFDNVPETVKAQTLIGSRIAYANYTEGKDLIDKFGNKVVMTYTTALNSIANQTYSPIITALSSTSPFDSSSIPKGKIRIDFTNVLLKRSSGIILGFNLITLPVTPDLDPIRNTDTFQGQYLYFIPNDYINIQALVNDTSNGFKTGLEGYFSRILRNEMNLPPKALPFPPDEDPQTPPYSVYNGFQLSVISANVIEINLPTTKFEIDNAPNPNTFVLEYYTESQSLAKVELVGSKKSLKSYRSYEIAMIHIDAQGRKTTATVSENNTVFVPLSASVKKNIIEVDLSTQKPPAWAKTYKFAIKENKKQYEEIYISQFYEDGYYRWAKIDGTNTNKVKEGSILLVKRDAFNPISTPVTTTVLELKNQAEDFLSTTGVEPAGLYMKINPVGFQMPVEPDSYKEYNFDANAKSGQPTVVCKMNIPPDMVKAIPNGSVFTIKINSSKGGTGSENNSFEKLITANADYIDFKTFFDVQINPIPFQGTNTGTLNGGEFVKTVTVDANGEYLNITGTSKGSPTVINPNRAFISVNITLRTTSGMLIFETLGQELNDDIFYETPDVFEIVDGEYITNASNTVTQLNVSNGIHSLEKTFNCFVQGNGAESYQILDAYNAKYLNIDFCPTAVSENEYKQINRFADITYSEPFNTNTGINKLNEFNLSLANFKDDVDKTFGPIFKIKGLDTNLDVFQEDKDSIVYYGKDLLYNADGTTNLTGIPQVLGSQKTYEGEYGISTHPESYARFGFNTFHTDVKRGVVIKKSNNGLFEISSQGMTNYFKSLFKNTTILNILGEYDQYNELYILNIKYIENSVTKYVTWCYSDRYNGWNTRMTFDPNDMCKVNNDFLSFNQGELYLHNQPFDGTNPNYNTFYGVKHPSTFEFNFSQNPSERKVYSTLEIEGSSPLTILTETDLNKGYINALDFELKEGVYYSYIRNSNDTLDPSLLSLQGIGNATFSGLVLTFAFPLDTIISIGDSIVNKNLQKIGTVLSKTENTLTLDTMNNFTSGEMVVCAKTQSISVNSMLGYFMNIKASFDSDTEKQFFAINTEVSKSFM